MCFFSSPQEAECAYFDFPELLSLRTTLILHLQHNTNIDVLTEFSGCSSLDWKLFLEEHYPYFLVVSEEGLNDGQTSFFNFLIIQSWAMGVNVVLSSGQECDILRFHAYIMQSTDRNKKFSKEVIYINNSHCFVLIFNFNSQNDLTQYSFHLFMELTIVRLRISNTLSNITTIMTDIC